MPPDDETLFYIYRKRGTVLLFNGYQFYRNKTFKNGSTLWLCSNKKKSKCRGSVTIQNSLVVKTKIHSCEQNYSKNDIDKQFYLMKKAASESLETMKKIYDDHVIPLNDSGINLITKIPPYSAVKSNLFNNRKKAYNISKLRFENPLEVIIPPEFESFILGDYSNNETRIIVFCSAKAREKISKIQLFFGDGTFFSCPPPFEQLYVIHGDVGSSLNCLRVVPLIYALMTNKKTESYIALLEMIKSQIPSFNPNKFTTDYEAAAMKAINTVFPQAVIKGCFYHYAKALWRYAEQCKITRTQSQKRIVAVTIMLALLPSNLIKHGWQYIIDDMLPDDMDMLKFKKYMERQWLKSNDFIQRWSVFGELIRTNNCLEGWHGKINGLVGQKTPNLIKLLTVLKRDSNFNEIKFKGGLSEKRRKETIKRDEFILKTNIMLTNNEIDVRLFLERLAWKGSFFVRK